MTATDAPTPTGIELIAAERVRQLEELGYTPAHDSQHDNGDLGFAAAVLAAPLTIFVIQNQSHMTDGHGRAHGAVKWIEPWPHDWAPRKERMVDVSTERTMPVEDRIDEVTKAGALCAAELDRLLAVRDA